MNQVTTSSNHRRYDAEQEVQIVLGAVKTAINICDNFNKSAEKPSPILREALNTVLISQKRWNESAGNSLVSFFQHWLRKSRFLKYSYTPSTQINCEGKIVSKEAQLKEALRHFGSLQKKILLEIYKIYCEDRHTFRWNPTGLFGNGSISKPQRSSWSNAKRKLIERGLVIEYYDKNIQFKKNKGNHISYISLTELGIKAAKWFRNE